VSTMTTMRKKSRKQARRANKKLGPLAADAREATTRYAEAAKDWTAPRAEAALDWAAPKAEAAKEWAAPRVEPAVTKVKSDVLPKVAEAVTAALAASEPAREEAKARGAAAVAALLGELEPPKQKTHRLRKMFLLAGVIGAAYAGWKAWAGQQQRSAPEPWAAPAPTGNVDVMGPAAGHPLADDPAAASPDEALADAALADEVAGDTSTIKAVTTEPVPPKRARKVKDQSGGPAGG
jgi:hypothetical protein